jgi:malate dehydrogenase
MPISVAILGASGTVGSMLSAQILRSGLLEPGDRLQLVGHGTVESDDRLLATRIDLLDAFDDDRVEVEMVPKIIDVDADIVVVALGVGFAPQYANRRAMGEQNRLVFEHVAEQCSQKVPDSIFIVVSNPVELAVEILSKKLDRMRVIGMGAEQDSLRFARAIAKDLGISRRHVRASVLGEHGEAMVPAWSTVELLVANASLLDALSEVKERSARIPLRERVVALQTEVRELLQAGLVPEAYEAARRALPDARIFVEPFITAHCMHSTPNATTNATLHFLSAVIASDGRRMHGQVLLNGEVAGIHGVCGVPITLSRRGWRQEDINDLSAAERERLVASADSIRKFTSEILAAPQIMA